MALCLLCGAHGAELGKTTKVFSSTYCATQADHLDSEVLNVLKEIDAIPPVFHLWSGGRREDSEDSYHKQGGLPVPQPCQILPMTAPGLYVGDLDDVKNVYRLRQLGIGFVLNLCPEKREGGLCGRVD